MSTLSARPLISELGADIPYLIPQRSAPGPYCEGDDVL